MPLNEQISPENILLLGVIGVLISLAVIRKSIRDAAKERDQSFEDFKLEIGQIVGKTIASLDEINRQHEGSSRAYEKRIETIEHDLVKRDDYLRENTLLRSAYDDVYRAMQGLSGQIDHIKTLIIQIQSK